MKKIIMLIISVILLFSVLSIAASAEDTREYCIKVKTADAYNASTSGAVYIIIYGENGNTTQHNLDDDNNNFETNGLDEFYITDIDVGEIKYIRITINTLNDYWCCDWIDIDGAKFDLNGYWFSSVGTFEYSDDVPGDKALCYTYDVFSPGSQSNIDITVKTDNQSASGTNGDVFIRLYSSTGVIVERELSSDGNDFETDDIYTYSFCTMDLQQIEKIDVWMIQNTSFGQWCLSYIKIGDTVFNANGRWIGDKEGITLYPSDDIFYNIRIDTQDEFLSGTDSDIYVKYIGDEGETSWALLDKAGVNDFEKGDSESYETLGTNVGTVRQIKLKNDGSDEWRIARVHFQDVTYHMKGIALEESEIEIDVDYSGASNVGSVFNTGSLIAICVGAALLAAAMVITVVILKKRKATKVQ